MITKRDKLLIKQAVLKWYPGARFYFKYKKDKELIFCRVIHKEFAYHSRLTNAARLSHVIPDEIRQKFMVSLEFTTPQEWYNRGY